MNRNMKNIENNQIIKFYANYNSKTKKYFISGKNEKGKYYSLWKSPEFNKDLYLSTNIFKKGIEIEKSKLKLLDSEDKESKVLVFKYAEDEKQYCITKEDIEVQKEEREIYINKSNQSVNNLIFEILGEFAISLFEVLGARNLDVSKHTLLRKCIIEYNTSNSKNTNELTELLDEELPF